MPCDSILPEVTSIQAGLCRMDRLTTLSPTGVVSMLVRATVERAEAPSSPPAFAIASPTNNLHGLHITQVYV